MIPDLTNAQGIAALFVASNGPFEHGENYIMDTDGLGWHVSNTSGGAGGRVWLAFDALPTGVDINSVAEWTPWTMCLHDGTWYYRSNPMATWETASIGNETAPVATPPQSPHGQLPLAQ